MWSERIGSILHILHALTVLEYCVECPLRALALPSACDRTSLTLHTLASYLVSHPPPVDFTHRWQSAGSKSDED